MAGILAFLILVLWDRWHREPPCAPAVAVTTYAFGLSAELGRPRLDRIGDLRLYRVPVTVKAVK